MARQGGAGGQVGRKGEVRETTRTNGPFVSNERKHV